MQTITGANYETLLRHLGIQLHGGRSVATHRGGKRESVSHDIDRGLWHDHATGDGGDAVDLVRAVLNIGIGEALAWLEHEGYREPSRRLFGPEITARRRKQEAERRARLALADFRRALDVELDRIKIEAGEADNDEALERAAN